jgi:hypothetical protein
MNPSHRFHLPNALRKTRRPTPDRPSSASGYENGKIMRIKGPEAGPRSDTGQSVATTMYEKRRTGFDRLKRAIPSTASSEASTEPGRSITLRPQVSSPLLTEGYQAVGQGSLSLQSREPRNYGPSSALHSHYKAQSAPLDISQQTSESSTRDRALRKGSPVEMASDGSNRDPVQQLSSFEFRQGDLESRQKKPRPTDVDVSSLFPAPGSGRRPALQAKLRNAFPSKSSLHSASVASTGKRSPEKGSIASDQKTVRSTEYSPQPSVVHSNPACFKVNVRRPKAGVKNWFDENDDENNSSDEDIHDEPDLKQNFVDGIEHAFGDRSNRPKIVLEAVEHIAAHSQTFLDSPTAQAPALGHSYFAESVPATPKPGPQLTLRIPEIIAQADEPVCFPVERQPLHQRSRRFDDVNLEAQSVLYLSSSEDEDEISEPAKPPPCKTVIRDSLAVESITGAEIEIGTAQAVSKRAMATQRPAQITRFKSVVNHNGNSISPVEVPVRRSSRMQSYLSDQSSLSLAEQVTPSSPSLATTEGSRTEGVMSSAAARRNSTRLMNVTRQEEVLLAQIRLKRAEMRQDVLPLVNRRSGASRMSFVLLQPQSRPYDAAMTVAEHLDRGLSRNSVVSNSTKFRESYCGDDYRQLGEVYSRASATTFQTNRASTTTFHTNRASATTFQTNSTREVDVQYSPSPTESARSPTTPIQVSEPDSASRRTSNGLNTHFATPFRDYRGHSRMRTDSSHIIVLDDLQKSPKRDARSQDFIEWPYSGWASMAELAVAH